jgi:hypothetical protein
VKTSRLKQEEYFGGAKFMKVSLLVWLKNLNFLNSHSPSRICSVSLIHACNFLTLLSKILIYIPYICLT